MSSTPFRVVRGLEENIINSKYMDGYVYFATDTKKIYLDANGEEKIPMGGNSGIYYGTKVMEETPDTGQIEFDFSLYDIEQDEDRLVIPQEDDLILNIPDGCFYRVINIDETAGEITLLTRKLTIAGSGGGGGGNVDSNIGKLTFDRITPSNATILYQADYSIGFYVNAVDASGEQTGNGTYRVFFNNVEQANLKGTAKQGDNYVNVGPYLSLSDEGIKVKIEVSMDIGGSDNAKQYKTWTISTTQITTTWDYVETGINSTEAPFTLNWTVSGTATKKTHVIIDDYYSLDIPEFTVSTLRTFTINNLSEYNLTHGSHKFEMYVMADIGGTTVKTPSIYKQVIFADPVNTNPIISCGLIGTEFTQYNTIQIPITYYSSANTLGNATIILQENGVVKDTWTDVKNSTQYYWAYTPATAGTQVLTIQSGTVEKTLTLMITAIDIDNEEIGGYAFKFKASDFASNAAIQNWNSNGTTVSFSENFDWVNGGLKTETENGRSKQYVCVKAGSTMTINYKLFETNAKANGKTFKFIFKATKCRDYDAQILSCYEPNWIVGLSDPVELEIESNTSLVYAGTAQLVDGEKQLVNSDVLIYDLTNEECRTLIYQKYIEFNGDIYFCEAINESAEEEGVYIPTWRSTAPEDIGVGLVMNAQTATFSSSNASIDVPYCEDRYIEFEFDVTKNNSASTYKKRYIQPWLDGVPVGLAIYNNADNFSQREPVNITIGSDKCDVYVYLAKAYEMHLDNNSHLTNFIADAPNAEEMIARYRRNDILDEREEISPTKLAKANPNCKVHLYEISRMTTTKKDKVKNCKYTQYQGSDEASLTCDNVTIKVQGTSSAAYGLAAFNLDSDFSIKDDGTGGFKGPDGELLTHTDENGSVIEDYTGYWAMTENSIPCDFFCTKVNVASAEGTNNALNQEWYNRFQPYIGGARRKNPKARDTMEFQPGVVFIKDHNQVTNSEDGKGDNVFKDTLGYLSDPYFKLYSVACMGNSKDNVHVFHDLTNPLECCVENGDNQLPGQWMTIPQGGYYGANDEFIAVDLYNIDSDKTTMCPDGTERNNRSLWETGLDEVYSFRYPDGIEEVKERDAEYAEKMITGWYDLVYWLSRNNPSPKYKQVEIADATAFAEMDKTVYYIDADKYHQVATEYQADTIYYIETDHIFGYTNEPLDAEVTYGPHTFDTNKYTTVLGGFTISTYANTYTHDTYEYRMAKLLNECEDHLVMDSIVYHYLFIERHTMVDNVAKNTFWSTDDCVHWDLTKDYDNDTADGNDNQGKLTLTYGYEPGDTRNGVNVFNASQSVWLNFIMGLRSVCQHMYQALDAETGGAWSPTDYLNEFEEWQSAIPERCWIEDYYRKYIRPYEVFGSDGFMFTEMLEGGKKTHQRAQYETYQNYYISSKYFGIDCAQSFFTLRANSQTMLNHELPVEVYADCYLQAAFGSGTSNPNFSRRVKRGEKAAIVSPVANVNDATIYFFLPQLYKSIGDENGGNLGDYLLKQFSSAGANKLTKVVLGTVNTLENRVLEQLDLNSNELLEEIYIANYPGMTIGLDLTNVPGLKYLDARNSTFTSVVIADNAPLETALLHNPQTLVLSNLSHLKTLAITTYNRLNTLNINNIDNSDVNSKTLVDNATGLQYYRLTNVQWTLDDEDEVDETNNTIAIIERLNNLYTIDTDEGEKADKAISLTGTVNVTSNAYSGDDSLVIYNRYAQEDMYPALDINFEDANAKLYTITIYDGDNNVNWERKLAAGDSIDEAFLSDGPDGAFDVNDIYKAPTAGKVFTFTNSWTVTDTDSGEWIVTLTDSATPYYSPVNGISQNLTFTPIFDEEVRKYNLTFFMDEIASTSVVVENIAYGTYLSDVVVGEVPYKEPPTGRANLYMIYDFLGYGLVSGASTPIPNDYTVAGEQSFYPIFSDMVDVREIVHPEWFTFSETTYNRDVTYSAIAPQPQVPATEGYLIKPKGILKGKITIPATYNGKPVVALGVFGADQKITHIFFEEGTSVFDIKDSAFKNMTTLTYFDFSPNTVRFIDDNAFLKCPITIESGENYILSTNLFYVGMNAFNGALYSTAPAVLTIPQNVAVIEGGAFNYMNLSGGSDLIIGNENVFSCLNLAKPGTSRTDYSKFYQNANNTFNFITFYSDYYGSPFNGIDPADSTITTLVINCFTGVTDADALAQFANSMSVS